MTISIVQVFAGVQAPGSTTATINAAGVTLGNALLFISSHTNTAGGTPVITVADGQGSYNQDVSVDRGTQVNASVFSLFNANAGAHTIVGTATGAAGTSSWGVCGLEVSGIGTINSFDVSATNSGNTSATPTTGTTATLGQASELVINCLVGAGTFTGGTFPPTGGNNAPWISIYSHPTTARYCDMNYQINTAATTAVAGAWGTINTATLWAACIATYKAASTTPTVILPKRRKYRQLTTTYYG